MLLNDSTDSNKIIDYDIGFDNESKKTVLEILDECFSRRKTTEPIEEIFLLHKGFKLSDLKRNLEEKSKMLRGGVRDLSMYYYTYGEPIPKQSIIGDIALGEEILVSRAEISCSLSAIINFILNHLSEEYHLFMSRLNPMEQAYIEMLLKYCGYERLSVLLDSFEDIKTFLEKIQNFDELIKLENAQLLEKIRYFKMVYSLATLRENKWYDRAYLSSISYMSDEMERERIQDIQDASTENTTIIKMLKLEPKHVIQK